MRVSKTRLLAIVEGLSESDRQLIDVVARLKLVSHGQLARVSPGSRTASDASGARLLRRRLQRLHGLGLVARLERRIGGVRAGSSGHVYYLGPVGQRLMAYHQGQGFVRGRVRPEPGMAFVRHRLSVSELYARAAEAERAGELDLVSFDVEPDCWRRTMSGHGEAGTLKPDAFVRLGLGAFEDSWFVEVDLGTESRPVVGRKLRAYIDYFHTGVEQASHGVFPRVLWLTNSDRRQAALVDLCSALPAEYWRLFAVSRLDRGIEVMTGVMSADAHAESAP